MSDRAALLAAIVAQPDEDTPRLVYADWLDEHGETKRAAFIRAQIEYHRLTSADTAAAAVAEFLDVTTEVGRERIDWGAVDAELGAHGAARRARLKRRFALTDKGEGVPRKKWFQFGSTGRGFYDLVEIDAVSEFLPHADAVFRAAPVTGLHFRHITTEEAAAFAAAGHLARVRELEFGGAVDPEPIRMLGAHRDAAGVRKLEINEPNDGDGIVDALAAGTHWTGVEHLELNFFDEADRPPGRGRMADLFGRPQFRNVHRLSAHWGRLDDDAARAIARHMPELRHLELSGNGIGGAGAAALAASRSLPHLRTLDLSACRVKDGAAIAALITAPGLPKLTVLQLDGNGGPGPSAKQMARPARPPGLRVLNLARTEFTNPGLAALGRCPAVHGLWYLVLNSAEVEDRGWETFLAGGPLDRLTHLGLRYHHLTERGAAALARWPGAARLQWLDLSGHPVGVAGAKALAASPHLTRLKYLHSTGRGTAVLKKRFKHAFG